jgi:hypothetical protein
MTAAARFVAAAVAACAIAGAALEPAAGQEARAVFGAWQATQALTPLELPLRAPASPDAPAPELAPPSGDPCAPPGMPALLATRRPVEIAASGDRVTLHYAEWDVIRTVYTNPRNRPPAQAASPLGVSFGRWEGETLAIFTTYISYPFYDRAGTTRQSAAVTVLERYAPTAGGAGLSMSVIVTDDATFTRPVETGASFLRAPLGEPLVASECVR